MKLNKFFFKIACLELKDNFFFNEWHLYFSKDKNIKHKNLSCFNTYS